MRSASMIRPLSSACVVSAAKKSSSQNVSQKKVAVAAAVAVINSPTSGAKMVVGPLIAAGASIIGGLMGKSSADKAAENAAREAAENRAMQKEFAQNGIQWKAADAKAAGIHPLYAMGASTPSFSPVSTNFTADTSMATAFSNAGQDIGRAITASKSQSQRNDAYSQAVQKLSLEKMGAEIDVLRADAASKVATRSGAMVGPPMPIGNRYMSGLEGQQGALVKNEPLERVVPAPEAPNQEPGAVVDLGFARTKDGFAPVPSKDFQERSEDNFLAQLAWAWRNQFLPWMGKNESPPPSHPDYRYDIYSQEYRKPRYRFHNKGRHQDLMDYRHF